MTKKFLHFFYVSIVFCVLIPALSFGQVIKTTAVQNPNVDYNRLKRIDSLVNDYVQKDYIKGVVTIMVKDNQVVQYKGYGYKDAASKTPMPQDAIFRIMSQTKALTSTGILILYERGKLMLDEPVSDFIPAFKHPVVLDSYNATDTTYTTVPANREITIRDLLTHTSGLDYSAIGSDDMRAIYAKAGIPSGLGHIQGTLLENMNKLAKLPLKFQPGTKWQYGLNSDLLGCIIEVISGMSLSDFLRTNIFEPLGMKDTYFTVPQAKANRLATVYTEDDNHHIIEWGHSFRDIDPDYAFTPTNFYSGGAGLSSTAYDYAIFLQMLLNKGVYNGHRILAPRTVEMMTTGQLDFLFNGNDNFGLGFDITSAKSAAHGPRSEGSFSWGGYYGTTYWADPKENMVCLIMTQQTPNSHGDLAARIEALMYASLKN